LVLQNVKGLVYQLGEGALQSKFGGWEISEIYKLMGIEINQQYSEAYSNAWTGFQKAYGEGSYDKAKHHFDILQSSLSNDSDIAASLKIQLESLNDNLI
jgi:hypothetical protein